MSSPPCCAQCEVSPASLFCHDEHLPFCSPCSVSLHSKRARAHHVLTLFRLCDECETDIALFLCAPCGDHGSPFAFCFPCSSLLHSKKARSHHKLDRLDASVNKHAFVCSSNQGNAKGSTKKEGLMHQSLDSTHLHPPSAHVKQVCPDPMHHENRLPFTEVTNPSMPLHPRPEIPKNTSLLPKPSKATENHGSELSRNPKSKLAHPRPFNDKENQASRNSRRGSAQKVSSSCSDASSSSSEVDTSEDDETYGTKKYRKGSVTLEAFVVDVNDHEEGQNNRDSCHEHNEDQPEGGVQAKIRKMLELGLHSDTPDIEAQQALKNAQRLLTKHNLKQADVLKGGLEANKHAFEGGMRMVELRSRDKNKPGRFEHWVYSLARTVAKYFDTQYFVQKQSVLKVVFYGIKQNVDCAGYAFAATFNRISKLSADYVPSKQYKDGKPSKIRKLKAGSSQSVYSRVSRMSYRNGLVEGLFETVKLAKLQPKSSANRGQKEKKEEMVQKDNHAASEGMIDFVCSDSSSSNDECEPSEEYDNGSDSDGKCAFEDTDSESLEDWGTSRSSAVQALVIHSKKIAEDFLKEKKIKVTSRKQDSPTIWDGEAFLKGKRDSKTIDIGQKGITAKARKTTGS